MKQKNRQLSPFALFTQAQADLNMNTSQLSLAIGYSGTSPVTKWRESGQLPRVAAMAIEALRERKGRPVRVTEDAVLVIRVPANKQEACIQFMDALNISYNHI